MSDFYIQDGVLTDYLGPGNVSVTIPEGVTKIGAWAFRDEKGSTGYPITGVVLPEGVTEIVGFAFSNCELLTSVTLPESLKTIGENAFFGCGSLTSVTLPGSLTKMGEYAFWGCESLTSISLPEGLESIGLRAFRGCKSLKELALPDTVVFVGAGAFSDCKALSAVTLSAGMKTLPVNLFQGCVSLKSVRVPEGVTKIESLAFSGCKKLEQVELPSSVGKDGIRSDTFQGCPRLVLVAPHLSPKDLGPNLRLPLVLGCCANPERYTGEIAEHYARHAQSNRERILEAAKKRTKKIKEAVMAYYGIQPAPRAPRNANADNPYAKFSEQKKVLTLEETILSGDMEKLEEVLTGCGEFECTARALGLACRYGSLEIVQRLVKAGATFCYPMDSRLTAKYDLYTVLRGLWGSRTIYHQFWYLLTEDDLTNRDRVGDLRNIRDRLYTDGRERSPIPETERASILRWLVPKRKALDFDCSKLLHTVVAEDKPVFADALLDEGVELTDFSLDGCLAGKEIPCVRRMLDIAQNQKYKLPVNLPLMKLVMEDTNLVARLLDEGNTESLNTTELLKSSLDAKNAGTLALCLERGFLKSKATREKLVAQSTAAGKTEHTAVLLEYINRNTDLAKERAEEEAKMMKDLTAAPDSVYMMKQLWRYRKQADGTLMITGYKGTAMYAAVPEKIGKGLVTAIADRAFSPDALRLTEEEKASRKAIEAITIPNSVQRIERDAFRNCAGLTRVTLPDSLTSIEQGLFYGCGSLTEAVIPEGIKTIGNNAFENCTALKTAALPDSLREIGYRSFYHCNALASVTLPQGLCKIGLEAFAYSGLEEITIPGSVKLIPKYTFLRCRCLREAVVGTGVKSLDYGAFQACKRLVRVTLPYSVREINRMAFADCPTELAIRALPGAYAAEFAKENFYRFEAL